MNKRDLLWLLALSLAVRLGTAALIQRPGYMDTAYYASGAIALAEGGGLAEPFIWNYLDPPSGVPHPGYLYWMPLTAILGWLGTALVFAAVAVRFLREGRMQTALIIVGVAAAPQTNPTGVAERQRQHAPLARERRDRPRIPIEVEARLHRFAAVVPCHDDPPNPVYECVTVSVPSCRFRVRPRGRPDNRTKTRRSRV